MLTLMPNNLIDRRSGGPLYSFNNRTAPCEVWKTGGDLYTHRLTPHFVLKQKLLINDNCNRKNKNTDILYVQILA